MIDGSVYHADEDPKYCVLLPHPVAARVLKHGPHVLEVDNRQFPLTVKPVDMPEVGCSYTHI